MHEPDFEIIRNQIFSSDSPDNFYIILIHCAFYGAHSLPIKNLKLNLLLSLC